MMSWFRAHVRSIAGALLLSLAAVGGLTPSTHAADCHDADCLSIAVAHDPAGHAWTRQSAGDAQSSQHCILCHLTRAFRPRASAAYFVVPSIGGSVSIHPLVVALPAIDPVTQPQLRAPPIAPAAVL